VYDVKEEHTAEHILMASIKKIIPEAEAIKVEHTDSGNTLILKSPKIDWKIIASAVKMTNDIIDDGKEVIVHWFEDLQEAKRIIPTLRANESRIQGKVRVIEISGHDYSACSQDHVSNTRECKVVFVTSISKIENSRYQIRFITGKEANRNAAEEIELLMEVMDCLGASRKTLLKTVQNLREEQDKLKNKVISFSKQKLNEIQFVEKNGVRLYQGSFQGLNKQVVMDWAGKTIESFSSIVLIATTDENSLIILTCSHKLQFDCSEILSKTLRKYGGKGGGNSKFASGSISQEKLDDALNDLRKEWKI